MTALHPVQQFSKAVRWQRTDRILNLGNSRHGVKLCITQQDASLLRAVRYRSYTAPCPCTDEQGAAISDGAGHDRAIRRRLQAGILNSFDALMIVMTPSRLQE